MLTSDPTPWLPGALNSAIGAVTGLLVGIVAFRTMVRRQKAEHIDAKCARLEQSFETSKYGKLIVSRSLVILMANRQARAITGYGSELVGMSVYDLIPSEFREKHKPHVSQFFDDPHARRMGGETGSQKFPMVDRGGGRKTVVIALSPFENDFGGIEVTVEMDVVRD